MRILQVTNFFKPSWESGGPARVAYEISKEFVNRGHEVTVYTTDGFKKRLPVRKNAPVVIDGIKTYYFENISGYLASRVFPTPYYAPIVIRKEIEQFDVVHIHEVSNLGALVYQGMKKHPIPYVVQVHGSIPVLMDTKRRLTGKFTRSLFEMSLLHHANTLIALTETEKNQYIAAGFKPGRIEIVPNGINLELLDHLPEKGEFKEKYGIEDSQKIILYLGRLNRSKGLDLLVDAFCNIHQDNAEAILIFAGPDDNYQPVLAGKIRKYHLEDATLFTGFIGERERLSALVDSDVFVTPRFLGFPVTFLEACACGIPLVTTTDGDYLPWIRQVGFVVEPHAVALQEAIESILGDPGFRKQVEPEAKRLLADRFNWHIISTRLESLYAGISPDPRF